MKKLNKITAILMALAMILTLGVTAFAGEGPEEPAGETTIYKITIDNAIVGETYTPYLIFNVTYSGEAEGSQTTPDAPAPDSTHMHTAYSYTISISSEWWSVVTNGVEVSETPAVFNANGLRFTKTTTDGIYNVQAGPLEAVEGAEALATGSFDPAAFAQLLNNNLAGKTPAISGVKATGTTVELANLPSAGYYFVDTTLGSLCSLDTTEPSAVIREKNTIPTETKTVKEGDNNAFGSQANAQIGDNVSFKITVTDAKGTDKKIVIHDTMSSGLTLDTASFAITGPKDVNGTKTEDQTLTAGEDYFLTIGDPGDGCSFEIELTEAYVTYLAENDVVTIEYTAQVNGTATYSVPETNKTHLSYSEQNTTETEVTVEVSKAELLKYDFNDQSKKNLAGAEFQLQTADGTLIKLIGSGTSYRVAMPDEDGAVATFTTVANGNIVIDGLDPDKTYWLEEINAPAGFNKLSAKIELKPTKTTSEGNDGTTTVSYVTVEVDNKTGTELPSTGGIGTKIFTIVGAILIVGAGLTLIVRRRMNRE